ncbi:MAG: vWA domain-containing protein [Planctomycetota bacterium]|nr:vWA domain-containing protein [Planctomycetota bacterium]
MNLPESGYVFVFLGVVVLLGLFVFWTYVRELKTCPFGLRITLGVLRFSVLFLLALVFLKPSISFRREIVRKPNIVLALDVSSSMDIQDQYRDPAMVKQLAEKFGFSEEDLREGKVSRTRILAQALSRNEQGFIRDLRKKGSVRVNEFELVNRTATTFNSESGEDSETAGATAAGGEDPPQDPENGQRTYEIDLQPKGRGTNIWLALRDALETTQLSTVVLVSDGQTTTEDDPYHIAREAKKKNIQVLTVGIGDPYKSKNVWVDKLYVPFNAVNPGDPFDISAEIKFQRVDVRNLNVELVRQEVIGDSLGPEEDPVSQVVTLPAKTDEEDNQGMVEVKFKPRLTRSGKFRYRLRILTEIPDEEKNEDNEKVADREVVVTEETSRVLLIAGSPTWEYQLVQRLIQRDPTYRLSCWLQSMDLERQQEGNEPIDRLPGTFQEMSDYNAVILIDPDPQKDLDRNFFDLLEKFVEEKAGGVMFMAGPKYTPMTLSLSKSEGLRNILPVEFPDSSSTLIGIDGSASTSTRMEINIPNIGHQVMRFFQETNENLNQWQAMPGVYWSYPAARAKPITKILIEHGDITLAVDSENPRPLLVSGRYGLGNTLYMGFNGTWRWRRIGRQAHYFDAFWINVVKFLVSNRSLQASSRGIVGTDKPDFEIGERIDFRATVFDPTMKKMEVDSLDGELILNGERIESLRFKKVTPGEYKASWVANQTGSPEVRLDVGGAVLNATVKVDEPRAEYKSTALNVSALREIARESGGEYFSIDNLEQLPDVIPRQDRIIPQLTAPEPIWGMPEVRREFLLICFFLPFVLLTIEWAIRKAYKLL